MCAAFLGEDRGGDVLHGLCQWHSQGTRQSVSAEIPIPLLVPVSRDDAVHRVVESAWGLSLCLRWKPLQTRQLPPPKPPQSLCQRLGLCEKSSLEQGNMEIGVTRLALVAGEPFSLSHRHFADRRHDPGGPNTRSGNQVRLVLLGCIFFRSCCQSFPCYCIKTEVHCLNSSPPPTSE